jgi:hypothetical protein
MRGTALLALVLIASPGCGSAPSNPPESSPPPPSAPAAAAAEPSHDGPPPDEGAIIIKGGRSAPEATSGASRPEWRVFLAPDGTFSALFPRKPVEGRTTRQRPDGEAGALQAFRALDSGSELRGCTVNEGELPQPIKPDGVDAFLQAVAGETPGLLAGQIAESKRLEVDGYPALETRFEWPNGKGRERVVLVGAHFYEVTVYASSDDTDEKTGQHFLDSFKVLKRVATAVAPRAAAPAPRAAPGDWVELTAPDGSFRALFPTAPMERDAKGQAMADGTRLSIHRFTSLDRATHRVFFIGTFDASAAPAGAGPDAILDALVQSPASGRKGQAVDTRTVTVSETASGRLVRFELEDGKTVERDVVLRSGARGYEIVAITPKGANAKGDFEKFLGSFKILKP